MKKNALYFEKSWFFTTFGVGKVKNCDLSDDSLILSDKNKNVQRFGWG